jgi:hypothetical protein
MKLRDACKPYFFNNLGYIFLERIRIIKRVGRMLCDDSLYQKGIIINFLASFLLLRIWLSDFSTRQEFRCSIS